MESKEMELKYREMGSDCTYGFDVMLYRDYNVLDFVIEILERDEFKDGFLYILSKEFNPSRWHLSECCKIRYKYNDITEFEVLSKSIEEDDVRKIMFSKVVKAEALDGWNGNFDFYISV